MPSVPRGPDERAALLSDEAVAAICRRHGLRKVIRGGRIILDLDGPVTGAKRDILDDGVSTPEKTVSTSIRLKPSLKAQLERIAAAERRTTNNWIVITLEGAVERYLAERAEAES